MERAASVVLLLGQVARLSSGRALSRSSRQSTSSHSCSGLNLRPTGCGSGDLLSVRRGRPGSRLALRLASRALYVVHPHVPSNPTGRLDRQQNTPIPRGNLKPSAGLEPATPSLPWRLKRLPAGRRRRASLLVLLGSMRLGCPFRPGASTPPSNPESPRTCPQDLSPGCCLGAPGSGRPEVMS
jgi:hypothetical protein